MSIDLYKELTRELVVVGATVPENVAAGATKWALNLGIDRTTELSVTIEDPGLVLLRSSPLKRGASVEWRDLSLVVAALEVAPGEAVEAIRIDARSKGVQDLKRQTGPKVWQDIAPHEFIRDECEKVGLAFYGEDTARRAQIARATPAGAAPRYVLSSDFGSFVPAPVGVATEGSDESTWDLFGRLATEVGFLMFEAAGTVAFGRPSWLVARGGLQARPHRWRWRQQTPLLEDEDILLDVPRCRESDDVAAVAITAVLLVDDAIDYRPGDSVQFDGIPGFEGLYIVTGVDIDIADVSATVEIATPIDPEIPEQATSFPTLFGSGYTGTNEAPVGGNYGYQYDRATMSRGGPQPGALALMSFVLAAFPGSTNLGIFVDRNVRGGSSLSVHAEGRACDFGVPISGPLGDAIATWLVTYTPQIGIQQVIWNRRSWNSQRRSWVAYTGTHPHTDHVHAELCWAAARGLTAAQLAGSRLADSSISSLVGGAVGGASGAPSPPTSSLSSVQVDAKAQAAARGWVGAEWNALYELVMRESSWRPTAQNPRSTAYGLFQFLDGTWAETGIAKTSDPHRQIQAGLIYIAEHRNRSGIAYGTPSRALAFHDRNNWY